jgi:hypothetical protein
VPSRLVGIGDIFLKEGPISLSLRKFDCDQNVRCLSQMIAQRGGTEVIGSVFFPISDADILGYETWGAPSRHILCRRTVPRSERDREIQTLLHDDIAFFPTRRDGKKCPIFTVRIPYYGGFQGQYFFWEKSQHTQRLSCSGFTNGWLRLLSVLRQTVLILN